MKAISTLTFQCREKIPLRCNPHTTVHLYDHDKTLLSLTRVQVTLSTVYLYDHDKTLLSLTRVQVTLSTVHLYDHDKTLLSLTRVQVTLSYITMLLYVGDRLVISSQSVRTACGIHLVLDTDLKTAPIG